MPVHGARQLKLQMPQTDNDPPRVAASLPRPEKFACLFVFPHNQKIIVDTFQGGHFDLLGTKTRGAHDPLA